MAPPLPTARFPSNDEKSIVTVAATCWLFTLSIPSISMAPPVLALFDEKSHAVIETVLAVAVYGATSTAPPPSNALFSLNWQLESVKFPRTNTAPPELSDVAQFL